MNLSFWDLRISENALQFLSVSVLLILGSIIKVLFCTT